MNEDLAYYEDFKQITNKVRSKGAQTKPKAGGHKPPNSLMKRHERLQSSLYSLHRDKDKENETPNGSQASLVMPNQHPVYGDSNDENNQPKLCEISMKV